jgi:hypothetical protein
MGAGNQRRYNNLTCFETFPFPRGLTPDVPAADYASDPRAIAIADAAKRLNELRTGLTRPTSRAASPRWCPAIQTACCPSVTKPPPS